MKKTETLRQLAASANEKSIADLGTRIEALRQAKIESADQLASMMEPIAQAMAALTDETRITLDDIGKKSRAHSERFEREVSAAATAVLQAAAMASESADRMNRAGQSMELRHYVLVTTTDPLVSGPRERILALDGAADCDQSYGRGAGGRVPAARDRSLEAVKAQISAMGAEWYEVVIVSAKTGRQTKREWNASELVNGVPWLKRMNAQGGDILLRPLDGPELLLVDALNAEAVKDMHRQGLAPAVTIETSPGKFQAWVKVSDNPLPEELRIPAVAGLARGFSKVGEYGRLAGFTNQQAGQNRAGWKSYVLASDATGKVAPAAQQYRRTIELHLREVATEKQRQVAAKKKRRVQSRGGGPSW